MSFKHFSFEIEVTRGAKRVEISQNCYILPKVSDTSKSIKYSWRKSEGIGYAFESPSEVFRQIGANVNGWGRSGIKREMTDLAKAVSR